jgi:DNA processing protein
MPKTHTLVREHPSFPTALRDLPSWPQVLHCHGDLNQEGLAVAVVGARAATKNGRSQALILSSELAARGHRIISGGALGVDSAAHEGALRAGGYTAAVMACGLDSYYPRRNQRLFEAMLERGGAIVSPYDVESLPLRGRFVRRNQIIAALADLVLVVEASTNSGSLHTARFALGLGRKLAVVPGSPGCEHLMAEGIPAVRCAEDIAALLSGNAVPCIARLPETGSMTDLVLRRLSMYEARTAAELHEELGIPLRTAQRSLLRLQLDLLAVVLPGQRFRLSQLAASALETPRG